ncbi:MAG: hypothetical protein R3F49_19685 [Planctomycetota bacterium]
MLASAAAVAQPPPAALTQAPSSHGDLAEAKPERRLVIALSDATVDEHRDIKDPTALLVEMPLQHLGLIVRRWSVTLGPPPREWLDEARAVVTWFGARPNTGVIGQWVHPWLIDEVVPRGIRVVIMGEPGLLERNGQGEVDLAHWAELVSVLGVRDSETWNEDPLQIEVADLGPALCAFEAPVYAVVHRGLRVDREGLHPWVTTRTAADPVGASPVLTGPFGGIALNPYVVEMGTGRGELRWHINLFEYLREALGLDGVPAFDPCVQYGRRLFFVQVDGDGFESYSTVTPGEYAAQVFLRDVLDRFALPFTVSIIVASVTDALAPTEDDPRMTLAREILSRPNVEVASHGVLHPLKWSAPLRPDSPPREVTWYPGLAGYAYSPRAEVERSIDFIDALVAPARRRTRVMLWTGDALPGSDALAAVRERGLANVNGGTYRWDAASNSVGNVTPIVRMEGDELQVFCGAPNENVYDGFFDRHPGAFRHLATTLEATGAPRILKPANIYVHFYAAERPERLRSIQDLIERFGVHEEALPVFASDWWGAAHDAFTAAAVTRLSPPGAAAVEYAAAGYGRCRTLRFDGEGRDVDFAASPGVLGARRIGAALYVHLAAPDPGRPTRVVLVPAASAGASSAPHLVEANHLALDMRRTERGLTWTASSLAPRRATLAGFPPDATLGIALSGRHGLAQADAQGRFVVSLPPGTDLVEVALR